MEPPHPLGRVKREPLGDFSGTKLRRSTISLSKQARCSRIRVVIGAWQAEDPLAPLI